MTPDIYDRVMGRVNALRPRVSSFSNYIQQLIMLDLQQGLLGPLSEGGTGKRALAVGS
ncbi:MAG: hypothetical protein N2378_12350 [Chloroflexaceae bacterium]|nr:hypothetical protein [Chloroflexaceae bacterium]